ncbi:MAG: M24 family metallopeptidase [Desulfurococcales archaeon]|nr:M24 family metallopeptidase [Desulfurococcales archaeon]
MGNKLVYKKIERLIKTVEESGADSMIISSRSNFLYITGIDASGTIYLNLMTGKRAALVPIMEYWKVTQELDGALETYAVSRFAFDDHPNYPLLLGSMGDALARFIDGDTKIAVDSDPLPFNLTKDSPNGIKYVNISKEITSIKRRKMTEEVELIEKASEITERGLSDFLNSIGVGATERLMYGELIKKLYENGASGLAFDPIVAVEENASNPHALPTAKKLTRGKALVVDVGAKYGPYCSDMTRTVLLNAPSYRPLLELLINAYESSLDLVRPGAIARDIDMQARKILSWRGLEKYFIHSLGHGVGVEVHEAPSISPLSEDVLYEGDVITIEPGFYIPMKLGMRVENTVLVTENGGRPLNKLDMLIEM